LVTMNQVLDRIMTVPETASYLKLSRAKCYRLVQLGTIPHVRIGRNVRIRESDLQRWIESHLRCEGDVWK
jgi:excisionase family DNA binding protein